MKKRKRYRPWWMRKRESCPECGYCTFDIEFGLEIVTSSGFDCPRCKIHFSKEDFYDETFDKWSYQIVE